MDAKSFSAMRFPTTMLKRIIEESGEGIILANHSLNIMAANRAAENHLSVKQEDILGKGLEDIFTDTNSIVTESAKKAIEQGKTEELNAVEFSAGERVWRFLNMRFVPLEQAEEAASILIYVRDVTDSEKCSRENTNRQNLVSNFLDNTQVLMCAIDDEGSHVMWNSHARNLLALDDAGNPSYLPGDGNSLRLTEMAKRGTAHLQPFEVTMGGKDGSTKTISWSFVEHVSTDGRIVFLATGVDISRRKGLEQELQHEYERLYVILNTLEEYLIVESNSRILFMNASAMKAFSGQHAFNAVLNNGRSIDSDSSAEFHANGRIYEQGKFDVQLPAGEMAILHVIDDVTEKRQVEHNIRHMAKLTETVTDAIIVTDAKLNIVSWNPGAARIFGYRASEVIGKNHAILYIDEEGSKTADLKAALSRGEHFTKEVVYAHKEGSRVNVLVSASAMYDEKGNLEGYLEFAKDITELRATQEQLFQTEKLRSISTLAGGIAHDFNNTIGAILGYTGFLKGAIAADQHLLPDIEVIENSARKALNLTRQLLGFARGGRYQPQLINLNGIVSETAAILAHSLGDCIAQLEQQPDLRHVEADSTQLHQVLMNLCLNSRDAMSDGGELNISTRNTTLSAEQALLIDPAAAAGDYVELAVKDTGIGMDAATVRRIFDPFYSTKGSLGLGLSMVYGIVKNHNGFMQIESVPGAGTTFRIFLPSALDGMQDDTITGSKGTIMVVDDEKMYAQMLARMVKNCGYDSMHTNSPEEAIELFARNTHTIDLVIMDIRMPVMQGPEVYEKMKKIKPGLKAIFSSGYTDSASEAQQAGAVAFLEKPYSLKQLEEAISRALEA